MLTLKYFIYLFENHCRFFDLNELTDIYYLKKCACRYGQYLWMMYVLNRSPVKWFKLPVAHTYLYPFACWMTIFAFISTSSSRFLFPCVCCAFCYSMYCCVHACVYGERHDWRCHGWYWATDKNLTFELLKWYFCCLSQIKICECVNKIHKK